MAVDHYENFPVASILLPRRLHGPVKNIYRFARSADDIADEGTAAAGERLEQLDRYAAALRQIQDRNLTLAGDDPLRLVFEPLARSIEEFDLPLEPFFDLLSAFSQDVNTLRYSNDAELFDYCRRSANPVGRLMLQLYQAANAQNLAQSDAICTGLQLTNFWQDIAIDWQKDRVYIPQDNLRHYAVSEAFIGYQVECATKTDTIAAQGPDSCSVARTLGGYQISDRDERAWRELMQSQVRQARELLLSGMPLARRLPGRIGLELRLIVNGGLRILEHLDALHYDIFLRRPTLTKSDWILLLWRAIV